MEARSRRTPSRLASVAAFSKLSAASSKDATHDTELLEAIQLSLLAEYSKHVVFPSAADAQLPRRRSRRRVDAQTTDSTTAGAPTAQSIIVKTRCGSPLRTACVPGALETALPLFSPVSTEIRIQQGLLRKRSLALMQQALVKLQPSAPAEDCTPPRVDVPSETSPKPHDPSVASGSRACNECVQNVSRDHDPLVPSAFVSPMVAFKCSDAEPSTDDQAEAQPVNPRNTRTGRSSPVFESIDSFPNSVPSSLCGVTCASAQLSTEAKDILAVAPETFRVLVSQRQANIKAIEDRYFCVADCLHLSSEAENVQMPPTGSVSAFVFGIADGHGGEEVAKYVCTVLPNLILRGTRDEVDVLTIQAKIEAAFRTCDENWLRMVPKSPNPPRLDPSCPPKSKIGACVVASLLKKLGSSWVMFTANCGDARAVLAKSIKSSTKFVSPASTKRSRPVASPPADGVRKRRIGESGTVIVTRPQVGGGSFVQALSECMTKCSEGPSEARIARKAQIALAKLQRGSRPVDVAVQQRIERFASVLASVPMSQDMKSSSLEEIKNVHARCNLQYDPHPIRFFARRPADAPRVQDLDNWEMALQDAVRRALNTVVSVSRFPPEPTGIHSPRRRQLLAERSDAIFEAIRSDETDASHWPNNMQPRVAGSLAVTRAIGDAYLKDPQKSMTPFAQGCPYITAQPNVTIHHLQPEDRFVVMGSDGLWDNATNEAIIAVTAMSIEDEMMSATSACQSDEMHPINSVGTALDAFDRPTNESIPAVMHRSASMSAGCVAVASAVDRVEDCLLGDPTQRLIGFALCGAIDRSPALETMRGSVAPLADLLAVPLARRRGLHDDITAMVVMLPSHLFAHKTPAKLPHQRSSVMPHAPAATPIGHTADPFRNLPSPAVRAQPTISPLSWVPTNGGSSVSLPRVHSLVRSDVRSSCTSNDVARQSSLTTEPDCRLNGPSRVPLTSVVNSRSRQAILAAAAVAVRKRSERSAVTEI